MSRLTMCCSESGQPGKHRSYTPIVDSPSISPANAANTLLNLTFPESTGIRSLPLVKPHETDLKCIPPCYELFSTKGLISIDTDAIPSVSYGSTLLL